MIHNTSQVISVFYCHTYVKQFCNSFILPPLAIQGRLYVPFCLLTWQNDTILRIIIMKVGKVNALKYNVNEIVFIKGIIRCVSSNFLGFTCKQTTQITRQLRKYLSNIIVMYLRAIKYSLANYWCTFKPGFSCIFVITEMVLVISNNSVCIHQYWLWTFLCHHCSYGNWNQGII